MKRSNVGLTWKQFQSRFRTESSCRKYVFRLRWPDGFVCPVCGHSGFYSLPTRNLLQCTACKRQTSVTAGTVMHKTRTPLRVWFLAMYFMSCDKRGVSALQFSKRTGVSYYVAWTMLHKIRKAMEEGDSGFEGLAMLQLNGSHFTRGPGGDKRRREAGSARIIVRASPRKSELGHALMRVEHCRDNKSDCANQPGGAAPCGQESPNVSDERNTARIERSKSPRQDFSPQKLQGWLQVIVSNARSFLLGTFHGIGGKHLQRYLDEFCFRFNRRYLEATIFESLVAASVISKGITYYELTL